MINAGICEEPSRFIPSRIMPKQKPANAPLKGPSAIAQGNNHNSAHLGLTPLIDNQEGERKVKKGTKRPNN